LKIREREPNDLDEALKLAQRFEVFKSAVHSASSSSGRDRHARRVNETTNDGPALEARIAMLESELRKLGDSSRDNKRIQSMESAKDIAEKRVEELSTKVDALNKEVGRLHHLEQLRNSTSTLTARTGERELTRSSRNGMKCFQCGEPGHFARNCPQKIAGGHENCVSGGRMK